MRRYPRYASDEFACWLNLNARCNIGFIVMLTTKETQENKGSDKFLDGNVSCPKIGKGFFSTSDKLVNNYAKSFLMDLYVVINSYIFSGNF